MVESAVLLIAVGGDRMEDMNVLRQDAALAQMLGLSLAALHRHPATLPQRPRSCLRDYEPRPCAHGNDAPRGNSQPLPALR